MSNSLSLSLGLRLQALSAQDDLQKAKEELKHAMTVVAIAPPEAQGDTVHNNMHNNMHDDEHDENHAEASAELSNEGVSQQDLRSEEARVTEAQKNERVKQQLQVSRVCDNLKFQDQRQFKSLDFSWLKAQIISTQNSEVASEKVALCLVGVCLYATEFGFRINFSYQYTHLPPISQSHVLFKT